LIINPIKTNGFTWELAFKVYHVTNGTEVADSYLIRVFQLNEITRNFDEIRTGWTSTNFSQDGQYKMNGTADINGYDELDPVFSQLTGDGDFLILFGERYFLLEHQTGGNYGDIYFTLNTETLDLSYEYCNANTGYVISGPLNFSPYNITLKNDFGSDSATAAGSIQFNGEVINNVGINGVTLTRDYHTFPHTATAINNQVIDGYKRVWRRWDNDFTTLERTFVNPNNYNIKAIFAKELNTNFNMSFNGGYISINGVQKYQSSFTTIKFYDDVLTYTIYAPNQYNGNFYYTFSQWKKDGSYYSNSSTIELTNLTSHLDNYTAEYTYTLSNLGEAVSFGTTIGAPIVINWNDNPSATNYQIWRRNKNNGVWTTPVHIGTVSVGVHTFTDIDCILKAWKDGIEIEYDVRGYYSGNGSYQDPYWSKVYGEMFKIGERKLNEIAVKYSIENYPNPFNPETIIRYTLPEAIQLEIKVYDMIGREVAELINRFQMDGSYEIRFDGSNLPSGVFVYTIKTSKYFASKKMMLIK